MPPEGSSPRPQALPHLVFSTRAAEPDGRSDYSREIVAESPWVTDPVRKHLEDLADMTGPVLRRRKLPPLWAFRRIDEGHWLVARAVSLGLYRKGNHQLLIHGVVLSREVLDWLDGNPFVLATEEAAEEGFRFLEEHPDGRTELPSLSLDPAFSDTASRLNLQRFKEWSELFRDVDDAFPALYDAVRDRSRLTAWRTGEAPDPRLLEWLLLHLHPADRAELSFHTWYAYEHRVEFDVVGTTREGIEDLRRYFRELHVWTPESRSDPEGLGGRARELRRMGSLRYPQVLDLYYLTLLPREHDLDLRRRNLRELSVYEADVCLRGELGMELTEEEEELRSELAQRGENTLLYQVREAVREWHLGPEAFKSYLQGLASNPPEREVIRDDRVPLLRDSQERFALLAILQVLLGRNEATPHGWAVNPHRLAERWALIVPAGAFEALLELFDDPAKVSVAERYLAPWIEAVTAGVVEGAAGGEPRIWPEYLRWLHRAGRPVAAMANRIEGTLEEAPPELAVAGYRELERVCFEAGLAPFAHRLLLQREVPRLDPAIARIRLEDGVGWLLAGDGTSDAFLGPYLADPDGASVVFETVLKKLVPPGGEPLEDGWPRCRRLLESQRRPALGQEAVDAAGAFTARLALSPLAHRSAEALELLARLGPVTGAPGVPNGFRLELLGASLRHLEGELADRPPGEWPPPLPVGLSGMLEVRLELAGSIEPDPGLDRALLDRLAPTLVVADARAGDADRVEGQEDLRKLLGPYLRQLSRLGRLSELLDSRGPWRHLLLDELLRDGSGRSRDEDSRYRAYLHLAWRRWAEESRGGGSAGAEMAVLRGLAMFPDAAWHRDFLGRGVPVRDLEPAEALLSFLSGSANDPTPGPAPTDWRS